MKPPLPNGLRTSDSYGSGLWHADRDGGTRKHQGLDFKGTPGEPVIAPCYLLTKWFGHAYPSDQRYTSFHADCLEDIGLQLTIFYMAPKDDKPGEEYHEGDTLGYVQDLRLRYPADDTHDTAITPHIHVQLTLNGQLVDPTRYFFPAGASNG